MPVNHSHNFMFWTRERRIEVVEKFLLILRNIIQSLWERERTSEGKRETNNEKMYENCLPINKANKVLKHIKTKEKWWWNSFFFFFSLSAFCFFLSVLLFLLFSLIVNLISYRMGLPWCCCKHFILCRLLYYIHKTLIWI